MHVLFLSLGFPPYTFGGVETYVYLLSNELAKIGIDVDVITAWPKRNISTMTYGSRLKVTRLPMLDKPIRYIWFQLLNKKRILNMLKKVDIVHSNSLQTSLINKTIAEKKPLVTTIHGSPEALSVYFFAPSINVLSPGDLFYFFEFPLIRTFFIQDLLHSNALIFVAHHIYVEALKYTSSSEGSIASKSKRIHTGIDVEDIISKTASLSYPAGFYIAYVGRLFWPKGITYALETFNVLVHEMGEKTAKLHCIGDGPLKGWVLRYVKKHKLEKNVVVYGRVTRDKVLKILSQCKAVLLPSLYEGCPYVPLEANILGIPVVAFDLAWSKEFIISGLNGYLSPPFDTRKLAENVLKAIKIKPSLIREEAKKYDIRFIAKETLKLYEKLL